MNMGTVKAFLKSGKNFTVKRAPELLTAAGMIGTVLTVVAAVHDTIKAHRKLENVREGCETFPNNVEPIPDPLPKKEVVKLVWKCYIPTAAAMTSTILCFYGINHIRAHREAVLVTACTLAETAANDLKKNVHDILDEQKTQEVQDAVAKDQIERKPLTGNEMIFVTGKGDTLMFDPISGRYFTSDMDEMRKLENEINRRLLLDNVFSLNEYYSLIGLPDISVGSDLGWSIGRELRVEFVFSTQMAPNDKPCVVVGFDRLPEYGFDERW